MKATGVTKAAGAIRATGIIRATGVILPILVLFILTRINYLIWPPVWPDEALFSSPAASLAFRGIFATPVLDGLLPGMEQATLWNSPLYMVLLSGIYKVTGESLAVARWFSFALACLALTIFYAIASRLFRLRYLPFFLTLLLALDPTFARGANTVRMDILALVFLFACLYALLSARRAWKPPADQTGTAGARAGSGTWFLLAGICTGLAGISHPIGVILVPMVLIFALPSPRYVILAGLGGLLSFSTWLFYIVPHWTIFQLQFFSQLQRKSEFLRLAGGDTGGFLLVFASQYGGLWSGSRWLMLAALLMVALTGLGGLVLLFQFIRERTSLAAGIRNLFADESPAFPRVYISWAVLTALILMASEAWYAIYIGPLVLLSTGLMADHARRGTGTENENEPASETKQTAWLMLPLIFTALFFLMATGIHLVKNQAEGTAEKVRRYTAALPALTAGCKVLYTRSTPDPYFLLRRTHPRMQVLEFIPGKLLKPKWLLSRGVDIEKRLRRRYAEIDCFLLDENHTWEPFLTAYLKENRGRFRRIPVPAARPLPGATLWQRSKSSR